jgi:hypothetical protein
MAVFDFMPMLVGSATISLPIIRTLQVVLLLARP